MVELAALNAVGVPSVDEALNDQAYAAAEIPGSWMRISGCPIWNIYVRGASATGRVECSFDGVTVDGTVIAAVTAEDHSANIQTDMPVPFVRYVLTGGTCERAFFYGANR